MDLKDRAQRFNPSKFDTAELVAGCGSLFDPGPAIESTDLVIGLSLQLSGFLILTPET